MTQESLIPPFTQESATLKVRRAEDAWNSRKPESVALAYTIDSKWRNRNLFISGRQEIIEFLTTKWKVELEYRLIKELFTYKDNRIAVRFAYEYHNLEGQWFRAYGNENWEFNEKGLMQLRIASINDLAIDAKDRKLLFDQGRRPDDYPGLTELGL